MEPQSRLVYVDVPSWLMEHIERTIPARFVMRILRDLSICLG